MKQIKFESNNKQWFVVDLPCDDAELLGRMDNFYWSYSSKSIGWGTIPMIGKFKKISYIKEITEEQASEVVDEPDRFFNPTNPYCVDDIIYHNYLGSDKFWSATHSLHSLLKSKGVDDSWINPVIFEIIK